MIWLSPVRLARFCRRTYPYHIAPSFFSAFWRGLLKSAKSTFPFYIQNVLHSNTRGGITLWWSLFLGIFIWRSLLNTFSYGLLCSSVQYCHCVIEYVGAFSLKSAALYSDYIWLFKTSHIRLSRGPIVALQQVQNDKNLTVGKRREISFSWDLYPYIFCFKAVSVRHPAKAAYCITISPFTGSCLESRWNQTIQKRDW